LKEKTVEETTLKITQFTMQDIEDRLGANFLDAAAEMIKLFKCPSGYSIVGGQIDPREFDFEKFCRAVLLTMSNSFIDELVKQVQEARKA
jgi:hypothetical protein